MPNSSGGLISIHALREEGDRGRLQRSHRDHQISIHALREEGDSDHRMRKLTMTEFLSTPSARRATHITTTRSCQFWISIHALREEGDSQAVGSFTKAERFLSTPSARRATQDAYCVPA